MIDLFLPPLVLVFMLVMIHAWFGKGVLERGIIFTDLAIAQFAALGSALSLGFFDGAYLYALTLGCALLSAVLIAAAARRSVQMEAFIGILYVLGASGVMMVLANSAEGMEHFRALLATDILFTPIEYILYGAGVYAVLGLLIWRLYPRLEGFARELLFFVMLAVTVTSSVQLAGVLVVFTLLVAPAFVASMQRRFSPLPFAFLFGWTFGASALLLSYFFDLPTGYTIVFLGALSALTGSLYLRGNKMPS
jgi:zinc/manganese transport system permease protein